MTALTEEDSLRLVCRAIDQINLELSADRQVEKSAEAPIFGRGGPLDSLGLVNLIVAVEQLVEDELSVTVALADERALSRRSSPFRTVGSLASYLRERLEERERLG